MPADRRERNGIGQELAVAVSLADPVFRVAENSLVKAGRSGEAGGSTASEGHAR